MPTSRHRFFTKDNIIILFFISIYIYMNSNSFDLITNAVICKDRLDLASISEPQSFETTWHLPWPICKSERNAPCYGMSISWFLNLREIKYGNVRHIFPRYPIRSYQSFLSEWKWKYAQLPTHIRPTCQQGAEKIGISSMNAKVASNLKKKKKQKMNVDRWNVVYNVFVPFFRFPEIGQW